jgi:mannose-6-phosphate isomerase class I
LQNPGVDRLFRKTNQDLLPAEKKILPGEKYDIYPSFIISDNQIFSGFDSLAKAVAEHNIVIIDGYIGIFYDHFRKCLDDALKQAGYSTYWINTVDYLKPVEQICKMSAPFLGGNDPLFGKRTSLKIEDYFETVLLEAVTPDLRYDINIIVGPGATLSCWNGFVIYTDLPKNELQFRARAGSITNLGNNSTNDPGEMYKCFYFVDWIVLNKHKQKIFPLIDLYVDMQRPELPVWIKSETFKKTLSEMSNNFFRVRPWFEPGAWGGNWMLQNINGLNKDVTNYAWSFELIVPENGLLIESSNRLIEVSFDCLMFHAAKNVLGDCYDRFGFDFPIRFDFLDTFEGSDLSLQCHPRPEYMREKFGESFTQEETYYILDSKEDAIVYLGFCEDIDPDEFKAELEKSFYTKKLFETEKFILKHPAKKHDLFLIPYGTIHGAGKNNLVLEISSTPYIFTFKMYDWQRMDLDGKPRPLNIKRGMDNLYFERKGTYISETLIPKPELIEKGEDWELYHLSTHQSHLYDIHRYHFCDKIDIQTNNKCLVMNLVEGSSIIVETKTGLVQQFNYAETFVIPAAAGSIRIFNKSDTKAILIKAFVK